MYNYIYIIMVSRWHSTNSAFACVIGYSIRLIIVGYLTFLVWLGEYLTDRQIYSIYRLIVHNTPSYLYSQIFYLGFMWGTSKACSYLLMTWQASVFTSVDWPVLSYWVDIFCWLIWQALLKSLWYHDLFTMVIIIIIVICRLCSWAHTWAWRLHIIHIYVPQSHMEA